MADSIYNVPEHKQSDTYVKNAVVFTQTGLQVGVNTSAPKEIKYYYALKDVPASTAITSASYWGGYTRRTVMTNSKVIPEFVWTPSYNLVASQQPKVNNIIFGNGYQQRVPDGMYNDLLRLEVSFDMRNELETRAIVHFLRARKGVESFAIKNLPELYKDGGYTKRFYCPNFNNTFTFHDNFTVKATFIETNN